MLLHSHPAFSALCTCMFMYRLKAAVLEAGTPFTPSYWQSRPGAAPSRSPEPALEHESDSENESSMTSPSGRLHSGITVSSSPAVSNQTRNIFRVSPASKSPQSSFRLRNIRKSSAQLAEDSISLSNRSDSSDHQHHLIDDAPQLPVRRQPSRQLSGSLLPTPPAVPRSAGRTRSPQRVAPAPGSTRVCLIRQSTHQTIPADYASNSPCRVHMKQSLWVRHQILSADYLNKSPCYKHVCNQCCRPPVS